MSTTAINTSTTTGTTSTSSSSSSGVSALSANDFMNLMITQLEHQDPMNPTDSNALLQQISEISTLQSNTQMQTTLGSLTLQQSIGAGGNLIGKSVTGVTTSGTDVTGTVSSVQVQNSTVFLGLSTGDTMQMSNVTNIAQPTAATTTTDAATQLQSLLSSLTGGS